MGIKEDIQRLVKEAKLYQSQGLVNEATEKYYQVKDLIMGAGNIKGKEKLLDDITQKIRVIGNLAARYEASQDQPQISDKAQELIKRLFTEADNSDPDRRAMDEAVTLAKFGQFERAISEFKALIGKENYRFEAAKNILKCHLEMDQTQAAMDRFHEWQHDDLLSGDQLKKLRLFFENLLTKKGEPFTLEDMPSTADEAEPAAVEPEDEDSLIDEEDMIDISSVGIAIEGVDGGRQIELDVSFQSGNTISLIINSKEKKLIESLNVGLRLNEMHFYSPIAIFKSSGVVSAKTKINSGPKQGDYCLDIEIKSL